MLRLGFCTALVALSGCSFALVSGPPARPPRDHLEFCTNSYGMPAIVDIGLAIITTPLAVAAGIGAGAHVYEESDSRSEGKAVSAGLAVGAVAMTVPVTAVISAVWGYRTANRCASYQLEYAAQARGAAPVVQQ